jgi:transposase-like protein
MNSRENYSSELKARIVLEMLKEELTASQIAVKYNIHQTMINKWKNINHLAHSVAKRYKTAKCKE